MDWRLFAMAIAYACVGLHAGHKAYWKWVRACDLSELGSWLRWSGLRPDAEFAPEYARLCMWRGFVSGVLWAPILIANLVLAVADWVQRGATAHVAAVQDHRHHPEPGIAATSQPEALPTPPPLRAMAIGRGDQP